MITQTWNPEFLNSHPMFRMLIPYSADFVRSHAVWPTLDAYQQYFQNRCGTLYTLAGSRLQFVDQAAPAQHPNESYEARIYRKGEIQTRIHNWHDFFQVLVWSMFPKTKRALNGLHYLAMNNRLSFEPPADSRRCAQENVLTQFDECGGIIVCTDEELLEDIRHFNWKNLFWNRRSEVTEKLKCIVFGHALYEKGLTPYLGMTAHCILLNIKQTELNQHDHSLVSTIDAQLAALLLDHSLLKQPRDLHPFPVLGMPHWHAENDSESFYDNTRYFRPGRRTENQFTL